VTRPRWGKEREQAVKNEIRAIITRRELKTEPRKNPMRRNEALIQRIKQATLDWARAEYNVQDVVLGVVEADEDELERWLVDFAVPTVPYWQVAEVWIEEGEIVSVNDLGEGVPPEGIAGPWTTN